LGLFDFLKKEEKKKKKETLPVTVTTQNVNEALLSVSNGHNVALSMLDFDILSFKTYVKMGDTEFVELDEQTKEMIKSEEFLTDPQNQLKQVYEIEIYKLNPEEDFELLGKMETNRYKTKAEFFISPESTLVYKPTLERKMTIELNKKKLKNSLFIGIFDEEMQKDIQNVCAKIQVHGKLSEEETIRLCRCLDPVENVEGKVLYRYLEKKKNVRNELIFPVKQDDVLIEIIKPIQGRNGRDCGGRIIEVPKMEDFNIPNIQVNPEEILVKEDDKKILYIALKDGYVYKEGDTYTIKDKMEVKQINLHTGNVSGAKDSNVKLDVKESDALKEAIADNMVVETTVLIVRGNVGNSAKINAKELTVEGQTHQKSTLQADKAVINVHKGHVEGKDIEVNRLEGGFVKGRKVKIKQAIGGKVVAEEVEFEIMGSHVEVYALKEIKIKKIKGNENKLIISPLEVLGLNADAKRLESQIEEIKRNIKIKMREYNKRKEIIQKNKPSIEQYMQLYRQNKQKGISTSASILKKIKEFNEYKNKTLEIKKEIIMLQKDMQELQETLQNFQTAIFNAKIISLSPWSEFNRIEFDIVEPPVKLTYDTKGDEGVCGFKLKDYGDTYKIVKIKVDDDSGS